MGRDMELTHSGLAADLMMALQTWKSGGVSGFSLRSFIIPLALRITLAGVFHALISWLVDSQIPWAICTLTPSAVQQSHRVVVVVVLDPLRSLQLHSRISWMTSHTRARLTSMESTTRARPNII